MRYFFKSEIFAILKQVLGWSLLVTPMAITTGSLVAFFLWLLNLAIHFRFVHAYLLYGLPLAGLLIHFLYRSYGKSAEKGNNLILDEIHQPGGGIPKRMVPLVLFSTVLTHLFGGSAGREGTAVQIGGSIASIFSKWFGLNAQNQGVLLTAGIAAGFGAVFGTPIAGAVFALEVLTLGEIKYRALMPCLIAAIVADSTVAAWHVHHTLYQIDYVSPVLTSSSFVLTDYFLILKVVLASLSFGLASALFSFLAHQLKKVFLQLISTQALIPIVGGCLIIGITLLLGKPDYLGLGVEAQYPQAVTISSAFHPQGATTMSWLWKTLYTTLTLASGYKGGEVTPLFYIGATLGNSLAEFLNAPTALFAGLGFIAVFAGATNTPLACTFMGVELFGAEFLLFYAIACFTAYLFSGHSGIYGSQRIGIAKINEGDFLNEPLLSEVNQRKQRWQRKQ